LGNESTDKSMISRVNWDLVLWFSSTLQVAEREAVLGDLAESGESDGRAVANIFGLVVRRHAGALTDWRFWIAFAFVILPVSLSLSAIAQNATGEGAVYTWMYLNNSDWSLMKMWGFWYVLGDAAMQLAIVGLLLACWSWSAGFVLSRLPDAIFRTSRIALLLLVAICELADAPQHFTRLLMHFYGVPALPPLLDTNAPVTAIAFYRLFFPWIVVCSLVFLPAISGMRQGLQTLIMGRHLRVVLALATAVSLLIMIVQLPGFGLLVGASGREWLWHNRNEVRMLSAFACWPTLYVIAMSFRRYRQHKAALA
jgi:hypothetical protein